MIYGRRFSFLWDTGSTENIMSRGLADELELILTDVHFPVKRDRDGYVVRIAATHTSKIHLQDWTWSNVPWLISDLRIINQNLNRTKSSIDGVLSPQLLLPNRCFLIDQKKATLEIFGDKSSCANLQRRAHQRHPSASCHIALASPCSRHRRWYR